jgi:branched-chain amino acid transport system substrate-binding protein
MASAIAAAGFVAAPALAQDTITFGASAPMTGPLAGGSAVTHWPAIHLWMNDVNERGGIDVGGTKMMVEVLEADDGTNAENAIRNIQRFATQDEVDFLIAPYGTGLNLATAPLIAQYGYPHIAVTAVTDGVDEFAERWPNSFWTLGTSEATAHGAVDVLTDLRDRGLIGNRIAVVNVADAFGIELANAGKPALEEAGFEIVYETSYPLDQQDFAPIISAAADADVDAFVAFSYPPDTFGLTGQATIADLDVGAFYVGVATAFPAYLGANGAAAEGVLGIGGVNLNDPTMQDYIAHHQEVTGELPDYWANPVVYASLQVMEQAITRAGTLDKQAVIGEIHNGTFDTVMGEWTFDGNIIRDYYTVGQWQNGQFVAVGATSDSLPVSEAKAKEGWE